MGDLPWALVTGASSGLGTEFALQLARRGHSVVLVGRDKSRLESVAESLAPMGVDSEVLVADLHDPSALERVATRLQSADRPIRVLVNNAGYGIHGSLATSDLLEERDHLAIHVTVPLELTKAALPGMLERKDGRIILVSSVAGYLARGTYSAHKAWGLSLARSLNASHRRDGVHVSAVAPGFTRTEFHQRMRMSIDAFPEVMWLRAERVVSDALRGVEAGRAVVVPSIRYRLLVRVSKILPARTHQWGT